MVVKLESEQIQIGEDKKVIVKQPSVLGGWVTILLLYLFALAATYIVVGVVDPFQVISQEQIDTFGKTPMTFRMRWNITKTQCDFTRCTEYYRVTDPFSMTVSNLTTENQNTSRFYVLDIATELYSEQNDYSLVQDQCCANFEVRPVPMLRVSDPAKQGLYFEPAFDDFNGMKNKQDSQSIDYQKVAELKVSDIRYMFRNYENSRNKTSQIVFNNRWNNLKLQSQDNFIVRILPI